MLGLRQPEVYGHATLTDVETDAAELGRTLGVDVVCKQSNYEGELVTWIQQAREDMAAIVINPGAYTHTSVAILDALNIFAGPVIEVHISDIHQRETFRHHSYVAYRADASVIGKGVHGYQIALRDAVDRL